MPRPALSLNDYRERARRSLPRPLLGYIAGACEDNRSHDANAGAMAGIALMPRVLRDVAARTTSVTLFDRTRAAPLGIAPMALSALMAYRGDIALACAAAAEQIPIIISGFRRGSDVMKALALGARMVFIGRPFLYAAAAGGDTEVRHAAQFLKAEIHRRLASPISSN